MTIDKTINHIGAYREEMEVHLDKLANITSNPLTTTSQLGPHASPADLLMSVFADHLVDAAARLRAVHESVQPSSPFGSVKDNKTTDGVIDLTDYREVPDGHS